MALHQYRFDDTPMALEVSKERLHLHKWKNKASIYVHDIDAFGIAYWGDEEILLKQSTKESIIELLKVEQGKCSLLFKIKNQKDPIWLDINNSNACIYLLKDLMKTLPEQWMGIGNYSLMCKSLNLEISWTFSALFKYIFKWMIVFYIAVSSLVALKYFIVWLSY